MNCEEVRQHWHVFHDSEGDAELHLRINDHLSMCPSCARWFFQQSRLEEGIAEQLRSEQQNKELWDKIRGQCVEQQSISTSRYVILSSMAMIAASTLLLLVFLSLNLIQSEGAPDLAKLSVDLHDKLASGREPIKLSSNSDHDVETYLRASVSFPVRCPPSADAGFTLRGAGTCTFANDPVAYIVGQVEGEPVSVFVMDRKSLGNFPVHNKLLGEQRIYQCREGDVEIVMGQVNKNLILVAGKVPVDRLLKLLETYESHSDNSRS